MKHVKAGALVEVAYTLRAHGPEGEELETCTEEAPFVFRMGQEEALAVLLLPCHLGAQY